MAGASLPAAPVWTYGLSHVFLAAGVVYAVALAVGYLAKVVARRYPRA